MTGLVYEEQLDNITKHQLKKSAWVESRSSPDLTGWGIQLWSIKFSTNSFVICHYFLQNTSKFFAAFADSSEKNNAAEYDFSDFFSLPAFLSLSAVFNNSPDVYNKNLLFH